MQSMKSYLLWMVLVVFSLAGCDKNDESGTIAVTGLSVADTLRMRVDETKSIAVSYLPENATRPVELTWSSSKEEVARVAADGTVQALAAGESVVTVMLASNASVRATCVVVVTSEADPNEELTFEDNRFAALVLQFDKNNDGVLQRSEAELVTEINVDGTDYLIMKQSDILATL